MLLSIIRLSSLVSVIVAAICFGPRAYGAFVIDISQSGGNVVATGNGSIDTAAATAAFPTTIISYVQSSLGVVLLGQTAPTPATTLVMTLTGPSSFGGTNSPITYASASSGNPVGIGIGYDDIIVPVGYVSGTPLADTATWTGQTLASLGLVPGTYVENFGSGPTADSITVNIETPTTAVPEPASLAIWSVIGGLGFGLGFLRRQRTA